MDDIKQALEEFEHWQQWGFSKSDTPSSQSIIVAINALFECLERRCGDVER